MRTPLFGGTCRAIHSFFSSLPLASAGGAYNESKDNNGIANGEGGLVQQAGGILSFGVIGILTAASADNVAHVVATESE